MREFNNIIEIYNLKKSYAGKKVVDIDQLNIERNQIYGLIGPNGAGKSTTMKMILGLNTPDSGKILVDGEPMVINNRANILKGIGSLIEGPSYYSHLTGLENMKIIASLKSLKLKDAYEALEIVGLNNHINKKVSNYSLGMKQRLGIAMAIIGRPGILILDEPTNGLDPVGMEEIRKLIRSLTKEYDVTILISSHILDEIEKMATHIGIINRGKLLFDGSLSELKGQMKPELILRTSDDDRAAMLLTDKMKVKFKEDLRITARTDEEVASMVKFLIDRGIDIFRISEISKSLEEQFIEMTGKGTL